MRHDHRPIITTDRASCTCKRWAGLTRKTLKPGVPGLQDETPGQFTLRAHREHTEHAQQAQTAKQTTLFDTREMF
jgi:hypothetical protein